MQTFHRASSLLQPETTGISEPVDMARTGVITHALKTQLRNHARCASYPFQSKAARLMQYTVAWGIDLGPIGPNFESTCDQIDRADMMLARRRDRIKHDRSAPKQAWPDIDGPQVVAAARRDAESRTVSIILDGRHRKSPCSPSPLTPATARLMSARSSSSKRACPKFLRQVQPPGHRRPREADRRSTTCRGAGLQARDRTRRRGHGRIRHDAQLS